MATRPLKLLLIRMTALMGVYTCLRVAFFLYHRGVYATLPTGDVAWAFLHGVRFDVAALCWINAPFLLIAFVPWIPRTLERLAFIFVNACFVIVSCNDLELYAFNGKRLSREFFTSLGDDFWQQLPQVFMNYWYLPLAGILMAMALARADVAMENRLRDSHWSRWWRWVVLPLSLGCFFVGIRGGLQLKSIQVQTAFAHRANELGHLTLNTPYHFLRTFNLPLPSKRAWFKPEQLQERIHALSPNVGVPGRPKQNVILIILESFSLETVEQGYAPFLTELGRKGLMFSRHFANGRRSIEVLSSLLDGVPSVLDVPFSKSASQGMALEGVGTRLRSEGWSSAFFHGAARGSMGFEAYTLAHGFQRYHSREDYRGGANAYDGHWGIYDGPWFRYSLGEIDALVPPFFVGIFTLSSHQPYSIPPEWRGKFPGGTLEIHESVGYTDRMLREFFAEASKRPWYPNTLFVVTADHTQKIATEKYRNSVGVYRVPLVLFHPGWELPPTNLRKVTQHVDVPATILDLLDVPATGLNWVGESVFSPGPGKALHYLLPGWQYVRGDRVWFWDENTPGKARHWDAESGKLSSTSVEGLEQEAKAQIQYLLNGLRRGQWPFVRSE